MILALAGGVGGAKLAAGLAAVLPPEKLRIVVNTGDDFTHLGLMISPDLDSVMYAMSGRADPVRGWGVEGETWAFMDALADLGGETWFQLGDRDLATHVERTRRRREGQTLSEATAALSRALGVHHRLIPMSDEPSPTIVHTPDGPLDFQDYFVRFQCAPTVTRLSYGGAPASPELERLLDRDPPEAVILCPSNPFLSIAPILALRSVEARLRGLGVPIVAVSPIVGGQALKGPATKIMAELGFEPSVAGVADYYGEFLTGLVADDSDLAHARAILGPKVLVTNTVMRGPDDQAALARAVLAFARTLAA